jgi:hypothetical protein
MLYPSYLNSGVKVTKKIYMICGIQSNGVVDPDKDPTPNLTHVGKS